MGISGKRARRRRQFRLESLEERNLLSLAVPSQLHAEVFTVGRNSRVTFIQGRIQGVQASDGLMTGTPFGRVSYSGHGRARPVGDVYFGTQHVQTPFPLAFRPSAFAVSQGEAILTTVRGDRLYVEYFGNGEVPGRGPGTVQLFGAVRNGTGRFAGVTGSFFANGTMLRSGRFALSFTTALQYPPFA